MSAAPDMTAQPPEAHVDKRVTFDVRCKQDGLGDRTMRFVASTGRVDRDGDTIDPKGIETNEFSSNPVFLQFHDYNRLPVGRVVNWGVEEVAGADAFYIDVRFPSASELGYASEQEMPEQAKMAMAIYRWYKIGMLNSVSIGFAPLEDGVERRQGGGFHFSRIELLEVSAVPVPSNRDAHALMRDAGEDAALLKSWATDVLTKSQEEVIQTSTSGVTKDIPAPPERFREQIRLGLKWHEEGYSGEGVEPSTIRSANALADGEVPSEDKIAKALSFFARHLAQDHPRRDDEGNPTPYLVALKLWGGEDEGPPYWRRAGRAAGMDIEKAWAREILKAGQTLNSANRDRTKQIIRLAAELLASQGMDAAQVLAEMAEEGEDKQAPTEDSENALDEEPDERGDEDKSAPETESGETSTHKADKMPTREQLDALAALLNGAVEQLDEMYDMLEDEDEEEPEPDDPEEGEGMGDPEEDGMDEDEDKSPSVEDGTDVDWNDVEVTLTTG